MSEAVTIIIDDTALLAAALDEDDDIGNTGGWSGTDSAAIGDGYPSNYNNTNFTPDSTPVGQGAWVFEFDGTSVSLFGITPPVQFNQTIGIVSAPFEDVDITEPRKYPSYKYHAPASGGQFYRSGVAPNSSHIKIGITGAKNLALDYALVTVGAEIAWNGTWKAKDNYTIPVPCITLDSPHSDDPIRFIARTSLVIHGVTPGDDKGQDWLLEMEFTLDGKTTNTTFTRDLAYVTKPHFTITNLAGTPLPAAQIDYITYRPSFLTIRDKPNFAAPAASGTQDPINPAPSRSILSNPSNSVSGGGPAIGAIVGGIAGGFIFLSALVAGIWAIRRRRKRSTQMSKNVQLEGHNAQTPSLMQQHDQLAAEVHGLEAQSDHHDGTETLEARVRQLQSQMHALTRELRAHSLPPSYDHE
ncbi:hypothetical protein B0H19DRAFT_1057118 [Mycena capillaripes]|nr:hypothetical protein B0H19DRAFT_1057118 [Mycena capillaripes]